MTLTGEYGIRVNLAQTTGTTTTGTYYQTYQAESSISNPTIIASNKVAGLYGVVGANSAQISLYNLVNVSGSGTGIDIRVDHDQNVSFSSVKQIVIQNQNTGTNNLIVVPGTTSSFLTASERMTIKPGQAMSYVYSNGETAGASTTNIAISASAGSTQFEMFIVGS